MSKTNIHSVRLTESLRSSIRKELLEGKFDQRYIDLVPRAVKLAQAAYEDRFDRKMIALMDSLPYGFLQEQDEIAATVAGSTVYLSFNGDFLDFPYNLKKEGKLVFPDIKRRFTNHELIDTKRRKEYGKRHSISVELFSLRGAVSRIEKDLESLTREIDGVLNSVSTTGKLVDVWPAIEPVVKKYAPIERVRLPAPILTNLNAKLGLSAHLAKPQTSMADLASA